MFGLNVERRKCMAKIRFTRVMIVDYEPNSEYYPEGATIEEMAQMEIKNLNESGDYESLFSDDLIQDKITAEIIEG
jgi:hypothetical protein